MSTITPAEPDALVDAATRQQVIERAIVEMKAQYIFPEIAEQVAALLTENLRTNRYDQDDHSVAFAERLTNDLCAVTQDKHISVWYNAEPIPERPDGETKPTPEEEARYRKECEQANFGVERVERLPLNIGYIDLRAFFDLAWAAESITAAMTLIAHSDALIIDLRKNNGGDPLTVAFMTSYLLDERIHLNNFQLRKRNTDQFWSEQFWTHAWIPGKRFGALKPVYVLTSSSTFSGAEEFSYNLKTLKRATLIGETTGGGANPGDFNRLAEHFQMFIPNGRAVNPITNSNWEGIGVEPDIKVAADDALRVAQVMALKEIAKFDLSVERAKLLQTRLAELELVGVVLAELVLTKAELAELEKAQITTVADPQEYLQQDFEAQTSELSRMLNVAQGANAKLEGLLADQTAMVIENVRLHQEAGHIAILEERQRLARDLHDSVTQALYSMVLFADATRLALAAGKESQASENLLQVCKMARQAMADMRLLIYQLHPPLLKKEGLAAALQTRLEAVESRAGLQTEFRSTGECDLPPTVEGELYRIAQEALNNVIKHAKAEHVTIELICTGTSCCMTITDDGIGFDLSTAQTNGGVGLRSIAERSQQIKALLTLQSRPNEGTRVQVRV